MYLEIELLSEELAETLSYEPVCEKTNNLGSDQIRHKSGCSVTA